MCAPTILSYYLNIVFRESVVVIFKYIPQSLSLGPLLFTPNVASHVILHGIVTRWYQSIAKLYVNYKV